MNRGNQFYLAGIGILLVICMGVGILTRLSYEDNTYLGKYLDAEGTYEVSLNEDTSFADIYFDNHIQNFTQLQKTSPLIVKVTPTDERIHYLQAVLTRVDVLDVYKGADVQKGDQIYIFEPSYFLHRSYDVMNGYNLMVHDEAYILFLHPLQVPDGYHYTGKEAITYLPVSSLYGKYSSSNDTVVRPIEKSELEKGLTYQDVKQFDLLTTDPQAIQTYRRIKTGVLQLQ